MMDPGPGKSFYSTAMEHVGHVKVSVSVTITIAITITIAMTTCSGDVFHQGSAICGTLEY